MKTFTKSVNVWLPLLVAISISSITVISQDSSGTVNLIENEIVVQLDEEFVTLQTRGDVFYAPLLAKVNLTEIHGSECYFNALWNETVLPLSVDLWTTNNLKRISNSLHQRKSGLCSSLNENQPMLNTTLCGKNITVSPIPVGLVYLESDLPHFSTLSVDLTHKRYPPRSIAFAIAVPSFTNCSLLKNLFNESSFLNAIYLTANRNYLDKFSNPETEANTLTIQLTNEDIINAASSLVKESTSLNISSVKYIREDYLAMLSTRLSAIALHNVSINYANEEKVRDKTFKFLCPKKETVAKTMKSVDSKQEAFPDGTSSLLEGLRDLLYCRIPNVQWKKTYRPSRNQVYDNYRHTYYYTYEEVDNIIPYLKFSLQRVPTLRKVRVPLTVW
jgi:hypothetical protein